MGLRAPRLRTKGVWTTKLADWARISSSSMQAAAKTRMKCFLSLTNRMPATLAPTMEQNSLGEIAGPLCDLENDLNSRSPRQCCS